MIQPFPARKILSQFDYEEFPAIYNRERMVELDYNYSCHSRPGLFMA